MTNDALQKTMSLMALILAGMQTAQGLKGATGVTQKQCVLDFVREGEAGIELFKPGIVSHLAVETAAGSVIDAIVALTHAHADVSALPALAKQDAQGGQPPV